MIKNNSMTLGERVSSLIRVNNGGDGGSVGGGGGSWDNFSGKPGIVDRQ